MLWHQVVSCEGPDNGRPLQKKKKKKKERNFSKSFSDVSQLSFTLRKRSVTVTMKWQGPRAVCVTGKNQYNGNQEGYEETVEKGKRKERY